ncbi:MAG: hypothetical protein DMD58_00400 [Gemmatimonadetes bacterium]|nr:MAG: hypothetical protein DMD58_00400 [Gemmatimonadota bacterium]
MAARGMVTSPRAREATPAWRYASGRRGPCVGTRPSWRSAIDSGRECRGSAGRSRCGKGSRSETAQGAGMMTHVDWIGWLATAVFLVSYFTKTPVGLRRVQGVAAGLWALYGVMIHSLPVIVANILVTSVAVVSSFRKPSALASPP